MTTLDYIKHKFSFIGTITDKGAEDFADDFGIALNDELLDDDKPLISSAVNKYIESNILHPESVNENGFSVSWGTDSVKSFVKIALRKYGIELDEEASAVVGLSTIKDATELW